MADDDYPSEQTLDALRDWPIEDAASALNLLRELWHWPELASERLSSHECEVVRVDSHGRYLRLATGGWSGNEALIFAFRESLCWARTWRLSAHGGLHIFQYPR